MDLLLGILHIITPPQLFLFTLWLRRSHSLLYQGSHATTTTKSKLFITSFLVTVAG